MPPTFGHCPFGGVGGLNACPDGLGHLFREELSKFKWAYPCFLGGLNTSQDGLGPYDVTLNRFRKHTTLKNGKKWPEKSAPECPVECGWEGPIAIWAMPKCRVPR